MSALGDPQRGSDLLAGLDRALPYSGLDLRKVGRRKAGRFGQRFDGQAAVLAPDPDLVVAVDHAADKPGRDQFVLVRSEAALRASS